MAISFSTAAQHAAYNGICFALNSLVSPRGIGFQYTVVADSDIPAFSLKKEGHHIRVSIDAIDWVGPNDLVDADAVIRFTAVIGEYSDLSDEAMRFLLSCNQGFDLGAVASQSDLLVLIHNVAWSHGQELFRVPLRFDALLTQLCGTVLYVRRELEDRSR